MKEHVSLGIIGLGARGYQWVGTILDMGDDITIAHVCDLYQDRIDEAIKLVEEKTGKRPVGTQDYKELINAPDVDAVLIVSPWQTHIPFAIAAMRAGKYVGCEVGGAFSIQQLWDLIRVQEETGVHCMMMENCCYGRDEMMVANMVKQGVFGELVHMEGAYRHDLRHEVAFGNVIRHYRLNHYEHRNADNYPTHELGPIAQMLNINRGNRFMTLTSVSSKAVGLDAYIKETDIPDETVKTKKFNQGDVVHTIIKCANGETILLTLDTTLPRFYSRGLVVQGTKAFYQEDTRALYYDGLDNENEWNGKAFWDNIEQFRDQYESDTWRDYLNNMVGGHGGMDGLVMRDFINCVKDNRKPPIDVYDMAAWMSIGALSEESIALGGHPVAVPDFTNGMWMSRKPE